MKTRKEILEQIKRIKADSRWPRTKEQVALIQINAPLALIQVSMEAKVAALRWVLELKKELTDV